MSAHFFWHVIMSTTHFRLIYHLGNSSLTQRSLIELDIKELLQKRTGLFVFCGMDWKARKFKRISGKPTYSIKPEWPRLFFLTSFLSFSLFLFFVESFRNSFRFFPLFSCFVVSPYDRYENLFAIFYRVYISMVLLRCCCCKNCSSVDRRDFLFFFLRTVVKFETPSLATVSYIFWGFCRFPSAFLRNSKYCVGLEEYLTHVYEKGEGDDWKR